VDGGDSAGGSGELARVIDDYGEILVPELRHYFGLDLRELFLEIPPWSPRYVLAHIKWLPMGSAFVAANRGGQEFRGWDEGRYMTAATLDAIRLLIHTFVMAHRDPKKRAPSAPDPYRTPDDRVGGSYKSKQPPKPGSFAFIAGAKLAAAKKRKAAL